MNRRDFAQWAAALGLAHLLGASASADAAQGKETQVLPSTESDDPHHLDAMQRYEALMNRDIHLLWKNLDVVAGDKPETPVLIPVKPTTTFQDCPEKLDVLFVPGGVPGTFNMMEDEEVLAFLAEKGKTARFVTSVCTGSLVLGAAGLLQGYKATSHWATRDVLKELGAIPTKGRVVVDRNRITGGGVTAGIDFGLTIAALLRSPDYAKAIQLYLEYDPAPPFNSGSPEKAPAVVLQFLNDMFASMRETAFSVAKKSKSR